MTKLETFKSLDAIATYLRETLTKKYVLLFGFNGTGKTRLSVAFKEQGKENKDEETTRDTLYFNALTEDLFHWDNDLEHDANRVLRLNRNSRFFAGMQEMEMDNRIRPLLARYVDFDFSIDYQTWEVAFFRNRNGEDAQNPIKISRGEENIFIWCFFLVVAQLAIDQEEGSAYDWVEYLYIDDPISSLDDNNTIAVACHLAELLKKANGNIRTVISTHHHLFFNIMCNELNLKRSGSACFFLGKEGESYFLKDTGDTPQFHHVALLKELHKVAESDRIYGYHFHILRNILEKTATFHGFQNFSACIKQDDDDPEGVVHARLINLLSHGGYSHFEPLELLPENKKYFRKILHDFMGNYRFNPELFPEWTQETVDP